MPASVSSEARPLRIESRTEIQRPRKPDVQELVDWARALQSAWRGTATPTGTVEGVSLVNLVADRLSRCILKGEFTPGTRLPEPELAAKFGVSRGPVREALFHLWREGIVEFRPRRGAIVAEFSPRDVKELYDLRAVLFGYTCREATPGMDAELMERCRKAVQLMRAMAGDETVTSLEFLELRTVIATAISVAAGNRLLHNESERLYRRALLHHAAFDRLVRRGEAVQLWEALLEAFAAGDPIKAEQIAVRLVTESRDEILSRTWSQI